MILALIACCLVSMTTATEPIFVHVFTNGGNNSRDESSSAMIAVFDREAFSATLLRIARTLNALPSDCTPFSITRPKRPLSHLIRAPLSSESACESKPVLESWLQRVRLHDYFGRLMHCVHDVIASRDRPFVLVAAGDHFVWPGWQVGHRVSVEADDIVGDLVLETLALEPRLFYIDAFLNASEAEILIEHARPQLTPSMVFDANQAARLQSRNSDQTWLACNEHSDAPVDRVVCAIERRVARVSRVPLEHVQFANDFLQVVHYDEQAHYHSHHDYFDPTISSESLHLRNGQQRLFTLLFYLNEPEAGGYTVFPRTDADNGYGADGDVVMSDCSRGLRVTPKRGAAILWYNLKAPGNGHEAFLDFRSLHGGCDVERGEKFAANKWVYNRKLDAQDFEFYINRTLEL